MAESVLRKLGLLPPALVRTGIEVLVTVIDEVVFGEVCSQRSVPRPSKTSEGGLLRIREVHDIASFEVAHSVGDDDDVFFNIVHNQLTTARNFVHTGSSLLCSV